MCSYVIGLLMHTPDVDTVYFFCNSQDGDNVCLQILKTCALQLLYVHCLIVHFTLIFKLLDHIHRSVC